MATNVTAIGEILWDVYPDRKRLGGAPFNFIYHVWKICGNGFFISSIGDDKNGDEIITFLNAKGFPTDYIYIDKKHPTGTVQVKLLEDKTPQFKISEECSYDFITFDERAEKLVDNQTDILYFGTLAQRSNTTRSTIESLFGKKIKYFCDLNLRHDFFSKDMIEKALEVSNVVKINEDEFSKIKNFFTLDVNTNAAIRGLIKNFNIELICITRGGNGALLSDGTEIDESKSSGEEIVDTVGAGDAYAAILCLGYLKKMNIKKLNKLANDFASDICKVEGAIPIDDNIYHKYIREFENDG